MVGITYPICNHQWQAKQRWTETDMADIFRHRPSSQTKRKKKLLTLKRMDLCLSSGEDGKWRTYTSRPFRKSLSVFLYVHSISRGELSNLASLGSENISALYFKRCFFRGGGLLPPKQSNTTPPSPKTEITNILFYIF